MSNEKQLTAIQGVMAEIEMEHNNGVEISQKVLWGMLNKALATERQQLIDAFNQGYREGEHDEANPNTLKEDVAEFSNGQDYIFNTFKTQ